ncbi:hypothetical protein M2337_001496 [Sphingobium sp. B2D3A]|nr:hypothetical protein [Sphingobium sp. B2D3A]MCW2365660.1 hypothetical protein [Sphingobium sp. B7D2B]MCW2383721.1 hypothetical protein [Sphingobium sp. B2D3D]MCW2411401.1 hypothetical protein [Sphingobium sp. B8D3D]
MMPVQAALDNINRISPARERSTDHHAGLSLLFVDDVLRDLG